MPSLLGHWIHSSKFRSEMQICDVNWRMYWRMYEWMLATLINWCETSDLLSAYKRKTLSGKSEQSSIASCSLHDNPVCLAPRVRWSCCSGSNSKATGSLPSLQSCGKEALRLRLDSFSQSKNDQTQETRAAEREASLCSFPTMRRLLHWWKISLSKQANSHTHKGSRHIVGKPWPPLSPLFLSSTSQGY